jgi:hypothetical protein
MLRKHRLMVDHDDARATREVHESSVTHFTRYRRSASHHGKSVEHALAVIADCVSAGENRLRLRHAPIRQDKPEQDRCAAKDRRDRQTRLDPNKNLDLPDHGQRNVGSKTGLRSDDAYIRGWVWGPTVANSIGLAKMDIQNSMRPRGNWPA